MRPIKFRAWDKVDKFFLEDESWIGNYDDMYWKDITKILNDDRYEIMQFTGLLDKNGKEIYEGYILARNVELRYRRDYDDKTWDNWTEKALQTAIVNIGEYDNGKVDDEWYKGYGVYYKQIKITAITSSNTPTRQGRHLAEPWSTDGFDASGHLDDLTNGWEIIGNIYENSELINNA